MQTFCMQMLVIFVMKTMEIVMFNIGIMVQRNVLTDF